MLRIGFANSWDSPPEADKQPDCVGSPEFASLSLKMGLLMEGYFDSFCGDRLFAF
jgi:hypothetical protein